ncbi:MAG: hypothetical protein JXR68_02750 [Bacteroidales bacterium]|nr:hypothetical protein [Bacteroidales bacterium]
MKPISKKELADSFGVSRATFMKWFYKAFTKDELTELNYVRRQKLFTKKQIEVIYLKLGKP